MYTFCTVLWLEVQAEISFGNAGAKFLKAENVTTERPQCLAPLDSDPDTNGKPSDHQIVIVRPISAINNEGLRSTRCITITQSGMNQMRSWLMNKKWDEVYKAESAHDKADILQTLLLRNFN